MSVPHGTAAWNRRHPDEIGQTISHHLVLFSFRPFHRRETRLGSSRLRVSEAPAGAVEIVPAHADYWARWHEDKEVAAFSLRASWLDQLAAEEFGAGTAKLHADALPLIDEQVAVLGRMLRACLRDPAAPFGPLRTEAMLVLLGTHLLRQYGNGSGAVTRRGGLAPAAWRRVRDLMQARLAHPVALSDLAGAAGLSASHFLRAFRQSTGQTPHRYLMGLRLEEAQRLLGTTEADVSTIAARTGFASHSHLTTAMRRTLGSTPTELRRHGKAPDADG